jgi:haloacetate dehalogenase
VLVGGNGSPILLLHGYPQTHVEWRKIAPQLSVNYTVVIPDLRGYGDNFPEEQLVDLGARKGLPLNRC